MRKKKLLVIRFSAMGDVAMLSPVIRNILDQNKDLEIDILSRIDFEPFFQGINNCTFIGINLSEYKGVIGIFKLYKKLKKNNYTFIIDAHNVLRSIILRFFFKLIGIKISVLDKGRPEKKQLVLKKNKKLIPLKTTTERYADTFRKLGIRIFLDNKLEKIKRNIKSKELEDLKYTKKNIGIAPFSKHKSKEYPIERMKNIIIKLSENYNIFLFGGGNRENNILEEIKTINKNIFFFRDVGLEKELDLIYNMDLMVTMDSSNMHMASLVGTKVLSIWGGTHYFGGFLGYGQNTSNVIQKNLHCRPCSIFGNKDCFIEKKYDCLDINETIILEKIESIINLS